MLRVFSLSVAAALTVAAGAALEPVPPPLSPAAVAGKAAFFDKGLSASGKLSCASCHDPDHAFAPPNARALQIGGAQDNRLGSRAAPSLTYARFTPEFHFDSTGKPLGGFNRDGREPSLAAQAAGPLTSPLEMASSVKAIARYVRSAPYAGELREAFGAEALNEDARAFASVTAALEAYQKEALEFARFASKYDDARAGTATLAPQEARGLALFDNLGKGNCASCHASRASADGTPALFTNFGYARLGVPRAGEARLALALDRGLCGPERADLSARRDLCGMFKVPSLRNAGARHVFFHNGSVRSLRDAIALHARGGVTGGALSDAEIVDIEAFLRTLTDDPRPR